MVVRLVRDHFTADTSEVLVDNYDSYNAVKNFMKIIMPRMVNRVKLYQDTRPIFSRYNIENQIELLYQRKVPLPSGGSIVFDTGEAMVSIDVNSGKTTSASELEETALKTNIEAADEIGRQLRLRDLGGLVVIDFIDMYHKKNQTLVEKEIKRVCKLDKARINISRISKFGLLEMSRQRLAPPVQQGAFEECSSCDGTGVIRSLNYTVMHVLRKISENLASGKIKTLKVEVSPEITEYLLNHKTGYLLDLQEKHKFKLEFLSIRGITWTDFKYHVTERTMEEISCLEAKASDIHGDSKKSDDEGSAVKHQSKARPIKGRRGRPTQRKRYVRRSSIDQRKKLKDIKTEPLNINASGGEVPASQSSKVAETYQTRVDVDDPQKPSPQNASISQPNIEPRVNTNVAIPLPVDPTLKPNRKNKDFFKRVADLFSKHGEVEKSPPPGTEP